MANTFTLVGEALALDYMFDAAAVTRPTAWYVALHTGANGGAGAANEIGTGVGYARQAATFTRSGNVMSLATALTFGPCTTTAWGTVTDVTIWDAVTGGRCLGQGTASASVTYAVGDSATMAANSQTITLT
jgi:hypothetical protein